MLSAVESESLEGGCGVSSMALTGFTNTLPMLKTQYQQKDDLIESSRTTAIINPLQQFISLNQSINTEQSRSIGVVGEITHGQSLLLLASQYKKQDNKGYKLAQIAEEPMQDLSP